MERIHVCGTVVDPLCRLFVVVVAVRCDAVEVGRVLQVARRVLQAVSVLMLHVVVYVRRRVDFALLCAQLRARVRWSL